MKKFLHSKILKDRLGRKVLLFLLPVLLFNIQNTFGQATPCASPIVYFLKTEGTTTDAALDGRIKLYGDVSGTNKVVVSTTALSTPTNNNEFTNAALFSSFTNGYIKTNAPNTNQTYYVRVYSADGSCYTDNTVNFEKTNFTTIPTRPDIMLAVSHDGGAFVAKNTPFTAVVTVQNDGTATATGLEVTVVIPAGLTVGTPTASVGTYNSTTGKWTIPSVAPGSTNNATLTFANTQSTTEGVKFISANLTAETQIDKDSSPTTNNTGEDDQDVACVSTPYELCNGNKIDITLASYTGIVWKKDGVTITGSVTGQYTLNANGSLTIFSIGEYSYNITSGPNACPTGGCCPIKVIAAPLPVLSLTSTPVSCFGGNDGTITATATSGTTPYEFSRNGTAFQSSGVFNTLTAGTYTITAKDIQGCTATATTTITQPVAALAVSISPTAPAICNGQSVNLNASAIGGTAPYTYTWSAGLGTGASKTVSPTTTTLYTVSVTDNKNCAATATVNVTVNQTPIAVAAGDVECVGSTVNLSSSNTNTSITTGLTYSWAGPNSFTSSTQNPAITNVTAAAGGVYTVTITSGIGGCTATATVNVIINPLPTATLAAPAVCAGATTVLAPTGLSNAATFLWSTGATTSNISVNPTVPTGYTLTVTSASNPACSITRSVWLDVKALPTAEITVIPASCIGSVAQGNGQLMLNKYRDSDQVAYGSPILATPTFANIPAGGIFATGLPNSATTYTIRLKNTITNCTNDLTALMAVTACPCPAGYCEPATVVKTK